PNLRAGDQDRTALRDDALAALHELASNAAKYGALSSAAGRLSVIWEPTDPAGKTLKLTGSEADGPPVQVPQHRGFGSHLIEEAFPQQFEGRVSLAYEATGVRCTLEFPTA